MEEKGPRKGMGTYLSTALKLTLGAGVALGGTYLVSRIGEKQTTEASLSRLEQMLAELSGTEQQQKATGADFAMEEIAAVEAASMGDAAAGELPIGKMSGKRKK